MGDAGVRAGRGSPELAAAGATAGRTTYSGTAPPSLCPHPSSPENPALLPTLTALGGAGFSLV